MYTTITLAILDALNCFKNKLNTSTRNSKTIIGLFLLTFLTLLNKEMLAQPYCTMACNDQINVSLGVTCNAEIPYDLILEDASNPITCLPNGPQAFVVFVMNGNGQTIPTSPNITGANIGQTLPVKVKHWATGNICWGSITIEDKLAPTINCPANQTVACSAPTAPVFTGNPTISDCSNFTVSHIDLENSQGCANPTNIITRQWTAVDEYGNDNSCNQTIFVEAGDINDVVFPSNLDDITNPALLCPNPNTAPENTGFPMLNNAEISSGGSCGFGLIHNDQIIPICDGMYKIIRTWTVADWCTGSVINGIQIIKVKDDQGPIVNCPADMTVSTTSTVNCTASLILPAITGTDNCSSIASISISTPVGTLQSNGGVVNNLGLGIYVVVYSAADACGNQTDCMMQLTVQDNTSPTMICDEITAITLNASGMADVPAQVFDDGSYDNCCFNGFQVRRMNAGCGVNAVFGSTAKFCCDDIGDDVMVQLQGADCNGNMNSCMITVHIADNINPIISCPVNVTIECVEDFNDSNITGEATSFDACGTTNIISTDAEDINQCGTGTVTRTFAISDNYGNSASCSQTITLVDNTPVSINFPPDYTLNGCFDNDGLDPDELPAPFGYPEAFGDDCELLATNYNDQVFQVALPACFKIVRTWTIIDWCEYETNNPNTGGIYTSQQILKVIDNEAPTITCPAAISVAIIDDCVATVTLPQPTIDDCNPDALATATSDFGFGFGPFSNVNEGTYSATYTATDGCGNSAVCSININVYDGKFPTPYCKDGLVIGLMNTIPPMVDIWASDFDEGSFDNCPGDVLLSFSADVTNTNLDLTCDDLGEQLIQLWVTDAAGNQDFCETFLVVQDNQGFCGPTGDSLIVGGNVQTALGGNVTEVMVAVNDGVTTPFMTSQNGNFSFNTLIDGSDYTVAPEKDINPLNGVSTLDLVIIQRHILGMFPMTSPYKLIAADANNSGSVSTLDLVDIRRLILHIDLEFQNNTSWRFVDADYEFQNPANPFGEDFPEVYNINNLNSDMPNIDFVAVKIGDVNDNVQYNNLLGADDRTVEDELIFTVENQDFDANEMVRVDFKAADFKNIDGYQFTLDFDETVLEFVDFEAGKLAGLTGSNCGYNYLEQGKITTSWNKVNINDLDFDAVLFSLIFQSNKKMSLNKVIEISSELTTAEAYQGDGQLLDIAIQFAGEYGIFSNTDSNLVTEFYGNKPNPFYSATIVSFSLPEAQSVVMTVFNSSGSVLLQTTKWLGAGQQEIPVNGADLKESGLLIYTVETAEETFTGKMILVE
jgi:hypothetical protein